jgi:ribonuclease PH
LVLCTACIEANVPHWLAGSGKGWITAEYNMLPGSTSPRKSRERSGKVDGRTTEIQRLIGRSLRAVADLSLLGERSVTVDCDVLQADGGTRTAAINGSLIALVDALKAEFGGVTPSQYPLRDNVVAVSVGICQGRPTLDLDYIQDVDAEVDMNVVMTGHNRFIELQGTGEEATFDDAQLVELIELAKHGIRQLSAIQQDSLGEDWPFLRSTA